MADTAVKPEIKLDPPNPMGEIEEFEDDADLHIPPPPPPHGTGPQAWLVKVPKYIWEAWNDIYRNVPDDEPIEIGKMRVYDGEEGKQDALKQKIQIRLNPGVPQHVELPKIYNLGIQSDGYSNTVVFSEKDLPGHRSHSALGVRNRGRPGGIQSKNDRYGNNNPVKPGTYRTAIPKQTALAPLIHHVADAAPEQDASYFAHFNKTYRASLQPKKTTTFHAGIDRGSHLTNFSSFGLSSRPGAKSKKRPKEKAVRIEQGALLDALYQCFRRYRYWSLKALRNELKQPETYIKQTLESIATLVRSGDFAMNYMLRPEYAMTANIKDEEVKEETALVKSEAEESEMEMSGEGDEDDFEDVRMED